MDRVRGMIVQGLTDYDTIFYSKYNMNVFKGICREILIFNKPLILDNKLECLRIKSVDYRTDYCVYSEQRVLRRLYSKVLAFKTNN